MNTKYKTGNEKGFAILLTLGFLALFSILALLFVVTSITNMKTARNYNDLTSAKILAQSAINRTIASMKLYSGDVSKDFSYINSRLAYDNANQTSIEAKEDLVSLLPTVLGGVEYYSAGDYLSSTDSPTWQYFPSNASKSAYIPITGRIAFIAIADNGKIMPTATVDSGENAAVNGVEGVTEYISPSSDNSKIRYAPDTGISPTGERIIGRPGVDVSEIWLGCIESPENLLSDKIQENICSEITNKGKMPPGGWGSSDVFFDKLRIKDNDEKASFLQYFAFGTPPDQEAFWVDNLDKIKTEDELFHRFNLQRTDWDDFTVDSIKTNKIQYNSADPGNVEESIPWLKNWKSSGEMGSTEACKNQIIANLIDYNDTDNTATSDNDYDPSYVGLEKCPYINEVKFKIEGDVSVVPSGRLSFYNYTCNVSLKEISVELVNMYDEQFDTTATVYIAGRYRWSPNPNGNHKEIVFAREVPIDISVNAKSYGTTTYTLPDFDISPAIPDNMYTRVGTNSERYIDDFQIDKLTVKLVDYGDSTVFYDFAKIAEGNRSHFTVIHWINVDDSDEFLVQAYPLSPVAPVAGREVTEGDFPVGQITEIDNEFYRNNPNGHEYYGNALRVIVTPTRDLIFSIWEYNEYNTHNEYILKAGQRYTFTSNGMYVFTDMGEVNGAFYSIAIFSDSSPDNTNNKISISPDPSPNGLDGILVTVDGSQKTHYIDYEIADPRQNLLVTDWGDITAHSETDTGTLNENNSKFTPNIGGNSIDTEIGVDSPWNISTAFVRNAPMKSPWELGAIHRGTKWQTINLKLYNETEGMSGGGSSYSRGDANILDQIKMGGATETLGKININTDQDEVLKALFYGIYVESGYNVPSFQPSTYNHASTQPMINSLEGLALAAAIKSAYSPGGDFKTRAQILRQTNGVTKFWDNSLFSTQPQTNDALQEEVIGKFINLTKAGSTNSIIIIAVAQTIDDVGDGVTVIKDLNRDGQINTASEAAYGQDINGDGDTLDTITETIADAQYGTYDPFADKVTSTQKVFAVIYRNPATNEFRIGRFEYLDN